MRVRTHKYNAERTTVDGVTFASQKEARRYQELKLLEKAGEIRELELQPSYPLQVSGVTIGTYRGDFRFIEKADLIRQGDRQASFVVVEDVKGFKTALYKWKAKHVMAQYGIQIREI